MQRRQTKFYRGIFLSLLAVFVAIEALKAALTQEFLPSFLLSLAKLIGAGLAIVAASILVTGVHEVGHYLAGRAAGFQLYAMKVGPLYWWRQKEKLRFKWDEQNMGWGYVHMLPKEEHRLLPRYRWLIAGGPIASTLLVVLIGLFLPWQEVILGNHRNESLGDLGMRSIFCISVLLALVTAVFSWIPMNREGYANDAEKLLMSFRKNGEAERMVLALKWSAYESSQKRCADWDLDLLRELAERSRSPYEKLGYAHYLGIGLLYQDRVQEGLAEIEQSFAQLAGMAYVPRPARASIALNTAFARAYFGRDLVGAKRALEQSGPGAKDNTYGFPRAMAAIALLEGDLEAVRTHVTEAKRWLDDNGDRSSDNTTACYEEMDKLQALASPGTSVILPATQ